jgi:hypothetical protein
MGVYVDAAMHQYGRMKMSHLMADTTAELLEMADRIGVARRWLQHAGTDREHFDICAAKRTLALAAGAVPVTGRELVAVMRRKRAAPPNTEQGRG